MENMRIFHLDAGRKYFSREVILGILEDLAGNRFTHLELYLTDNQGFRFALEDMVLSTGFAAYDLSPCLGDGYCQEDKGPDGSNGYLTEADMEEILARGRELGVEVYPVVNMPGHMGALLERFPHLRAAGSRSSIDLEKEEAVAFALGLLQKYAAWFAKRGCRFFHFGADEYANDTGTMGFDTIYRDGRMARFVSFVNEAVSIITNLGMIPMAFNDGIYYGDDKGYGEIDSRLVVCYWIQGWNTYFPADSAFLQKEGFRLINAHHSYYCGMGRDLEERAEAMAGYDPRLFDKASRIESPLGAMLCFWCDRAYLHGPDGGVKAAKGMKPVFGSFCRTMDAYGF